MKKSTFLQLTGLLLGPIGLFLHVLYSYFPNYGEAFYSASLNKFFIQLLSKLTGVFPFSVHELLVYALILFIPCFLIRSFIKGRKCSEGWKVFLLSWLFKIGVCLSTFVFVFISFWGLNYSRPSLNQHYGFYHGLHTEEELATLYGFLITKCNELREDLPHDENYVFTLEEDTKETFKRASLGYQEAAKLFPTLSGDYGLPKPVLVSQLMSYTGTMGTYSPFTGEANINTSIPDFWLPSTTTHEMAHQRGYALEEDANFIAFLTCSLHPDRDFQYSGYLLALVHTESALWAINKDRVLALRPTLSFKVQVDLNYNNTFWSPYEGWIQDVSSQINDSYLKANGVADGEKSYGRMVDLLLDYYETYLQ